MSDNNEDEHDKTDEVQERLKNGETLGGEAYDADEMVLALDDEEDSDDE